MKKIPTILKRDPDIMRWVTNEVNPECQWVIDGEGIITRKYDGTCVMLDDKCAWWARREVKKDKPEPENFVLEDFDEVTGKKQGWEPIEQSAFYKFWKEAVDGENWEPGTYELCGPKINGNPEDYDSHELVSHRDALIIQEPGYAGENRSPEYLKKLVRMLATHNYEGIVVHHPDGRMAKLKVRDFPKE